MLKKKNFWTLLLVFFVGIQISFANGGKVDVYKQFKMDYPSVNDVSWIETKDCFIACFREDSILNRVYYNKKGRINGTLRYLQQENLQEEIQSLISQEYPRKKIFGVTEITVSNRTSYQIKLVDDRKWYDVLIDEEGTISLMDEYLKG
jgi:hypothetical protein